MPGTAADLKAANLISQWVARKTELKPRGREGRFVGLCPKHDDHHPSLVVDDHGSRNGTGTFRCWVCGVGGDLFDFLVWTEGMSISEAIEHVAENTSGWNKKKTDPAEVIRRQKRKEAADIMEAAVAWFKSQLRPDHVELLATRNKLSAATVQIAEIGYGAPGFRQAMKFAGYTDVQLYEVALLDKTDEGKLYFPFENLLTIPMRDQGRIVYLTGRKTEDSPVQKKYRHQTVTRAGDEPHSPFIYRPLYWIDSLRKPDVDRLYIVEGPMDALAVQQRSSLIGENLAVVAHLGNALTIEQANNLAPMAQGLEVIILADGDDAGIYGGKTLSGGAIKSAEVLAQVGVSARILICKADTDPSSMGDEIGELKELLDAVTVWCREVLPGLTSQKQTDLLKTRLVPLLASYAVIERGQAITQLADALSQNPLTIKAAISEYLKESPAEKADQYARTDLGNAKRLIDTYGDNLHYCYPQQAWYVWSENRWEVDRIGRLEKYGSEVLSTLQREAAKMTGEARQAMRRFADLSEKQPRRIAMIQSAQHIGDIPILPAQLDADPWLLNTMSGVVDLHTLNVQEARRESLCSKLAPVVYSNQAQCPSWLKFLDEITAGNMDLQQYLQRAVGYSLTGDTSEECFFLLYGATGQNGKSTFLRVVQAMLGDYATTASFDTFLARKGDAGIRNDVAALVGRRMVIAIEANAGKMLDEALIKSITGRDLITARFMRQEFFTFMPQFKLWLATNHQPVIRGTDGAMWRRVKKIPFVVRIPDERLDKHLDDKLHQERPGIFVWALEGLSMWKQDGLGDCQTVEMATQDYRDESDVLAEFIIDEVREDITAPLMTGRELYGVYQHWCETAGERFPFSYRNFNEELRSRGLQSSRSDKGLCWKGLALKTDEAPTLTYIQDKRNE